MMWPDGGGETRAQKAETRVAELEKCLESERKDLIRVEAQWRAERDAYKEALEEIATLTGDEPHPNAGHALDAWAIARCALEKPE